MKQFLSLLEQYRQLNLSEVLNYELINEILISHHSTAIEGSSLTEEETLLLLTEGLTAKGKPLNDHNMVKDHQDALIWILAQAKGKKEITSRFIQEISSHVMKSTGGVINAMAGEYDSSKGDWRKSNVYVGTRYFISYQKVATEIEKLVKWINDNLKVVQTDTDKYNLAFDAHYKLVTIHPFADGNGRTSRLLMNYILSYYGLPLATIFKEDKSDYYKALEQCRKDDENTRAIREFMFEQQIKYFEQEIEKYKKINCQKNQDFNLGI